MEAAQVVLMQVLREGMATTNILGILDKILPPLAAYLMEPIN
jgi:hypothetical protein